MMLKPSRVTRYVACVVAACVAANAGTAQAQKMLRFKFTPGQTFKYQMVQTMDLSMRQGENAVPMAFTTKQIMDMTWTVESVAAEGGIVIAQKTDRIQMKMQSAQGVVMEYDTASEEEPEGMARSVAPLYESMVREPIRTTLTPRGEVKDMKLPQGMLENLNKAVGQGPAGNVFSEDWMKQIGQMGVLPERPVQPGDTWTREDSWKMPGIGEQKVESSFRYEGPETRDGKTLEKISMSMRFKPGEEKEKGMVALSENEAEGINYFDAESGHAVETFVKLKMKVDINVLGQQMSQDIDMNMEMKLQPAAPTTATEP
jgi:hypothetical protein